MKKLIKQIRINNLQFNANRDPQIYRRQPGEAFRIQALLDGSGSARCCLRDAGGQVIREQSIALPGAFSHEIAYPDTGVRLISLELESNGETLRQDIRLDVVEAAHA